jgi:hypothetical protein
LPLKTWRSRLGAHSSRVICFLVPAGWDILDDTSGTIIAAE